MIPIAKPILGQQEIEAVVEVLKSGFLAEGKVSREFEKAFAEYVGTEYATVATNGTAALSTALDALEIKPGDEVITTPFTFIASANTIAMMGAVPIFVDIDPSTYNISPERIEGAITEKTRAIMPVHIFGMPAEMKRIMEIAEDHDLFVLEDACQAHGAEIDGKKVGSFAHVSAFSFYATKNMMTGEGGMITTDDEEIYDRCLMIKNHGRGKKGGYSHFRIGYNNRMMDLVSAIGIEQLKRLPGVVKARRQNAAYYDDMFSELKSVVPQEELKNFESSYHVYAPLLHHEEIDRDKMIDLLKKHEVGSRSVYALPCHKQDTYLNIEDWRWAEFVDYPDYSEISLPASEMVGNKHFEIPVHPGVSKEDREHIAHVVYETLS
ncbi:DegT/DnrJ/EryC1/StrS family aminotransferase [Candidatus Thorarchaeota archaeon]|nr:MAG: DegT/DnrJ/EryC1/StrS family aminotransferase [Candidatus Thorarchaeota archaeon]